MSQQPKELEIFSILNKEKISKIIDLLDESIVEEQFDSPKLQDLEKLGFTNKQAEDILECFFNFYTNIEHYDLVMSVIDSSNLTSDTKSLTKNAYEEIRKRADKTKVKIFEEVTELEIFGHKHLHNLKVTSEFRPIVKNGKLERIVSSIVWEGSAQSKDHKTKTLINFQMNLSTFEELVKELNVDLENIKTQITTLKKQLGDNIVK